MKSSTKTIVYEMPHELSRLRTLGNSEIMEKTQKWVEAESTAQSHVQK